MSGRHKKHVILIGGLGDGLLPVPYTTVLSEALDAKGWSLVQVLLSSSYTGFGYSSLRQDVQEISNLLHYLTEVEGSEGIGLVGHSTGCQDSVFYVKEGQHKDALRFIVLQAPVSDREHLMMQANTADAITLARSMKEAGKGQEMLPRKAMWSPITADRFLGLATKEGLDDMFSSDLSEKELQDRLGHVDVPTLLLFSGADEYVPKDLNMAELGDRLIKGLVSGSSSSSKDGPPVNLSRYEIIEGASHSCKGHEDQVVAKILQFMDDLS